MLKLDTLRYNQTFLSMYQAKVKEPIEPSKYVMFLSYSGDKTVLSSLETEQMLDDNNITVKPLHNGHLLDAAIIGRLGYKDTCFFFQGLQQFYFVKILIVVVYTVR